MKTSSQGSHERLEAALGAAMDAALKRAGGQAGRVIATARLATAVHMGRAAEHAAAESGGATFSASLNHRAASAAGTDAARLARRGGVL